MVRSEYHPGFQYFEQLTLEWFFGGAGSNSSGWVKKSWGDLDFRMGIYTLSKADMTIIYNHWSGASTKRSPTCSACLLIPSDSKHCQGEVTPRQQTACQSVGERVQVKGERCWCGRWEWSFGYLGPRWFYEPSWNGRTSHVTCNFGLKFLTSTCCETPTQPFLDYW